MSELVWHQVRWLCLLRVEAKMIRRRFKFAFVFHILWTQQSRAITTEYLLSKGAACLWLHFWFDVTVSWVPAALTLFWPRQTDYSWVVQFSVWNRGLSLIEFLCAFLLTPFLGSKSGTLWWSQSVLPQLARAWSLQFPLYCFEFSLGWVGLTHYVFLASLLIYACRP